LYLFFELRRRARAAVLKEAAEEVFAPRKLPAPCAAPR
jgi:hypothetical protein